MKKKGSELKKLNGGYFRVAVFGSARIKKNDPLYKEVKDLAKKLGEANIDVITGGGPGLMQAANEGHIIGSKKSGGKAISIGIGIKLPREQQFNESVEFKKEFKVFSKRLDEFMLLSNAVVIAPGGIGTLLELFYTWQLVQVNHICHIPIIFMGDTWKGLLKWIKDEPLKNKYLDEIDYNSVYFAKNTEDALKIIEDAHNHFKTGGKEFCLNYKKYKTK